MHRLAGGGLIILLALLLAGCVGDVNNFISSSLTGYLYRGAGDAWRIEPEPRADLTPLAGATMTCAGLAGPETATSAADGSFNLTGLPSGPLDLRATLPGNVEARWSLNLAVGDNRLSAESHAPAARYKWTVLVYMAADNTLDGDAPSDLNEMEAVGSTSEVAVVVQCDRLGRGNTLRYEITRDDDPATVTSPVRENLGEPDMGSPETLRAFLAWGQQQYPAEHYLLVLWDHGSGWDPVHRSTRAIAEDLSHDSMIAVTDLPRALDGVYPVDIIAMDACLMGMAEVAYEVRTTARYLVAASDLVPTKGYDYRRVLQPLADAPATAPRDLSTLIAREAVASWADSQYGGCAAIDLSQMDAVARSLDDVSARLLTASRYYRAAAGDARSGAHILGGNSQDVHADLYDYLDQLRDRTPDTTLHARIDTAQTMIEAAVVENATSPGRTRVHGLAIYLPSRAHYTTPGPAANRPAPSTVYPELALARNTRWNEWLGEQP